MSAVEAASASVQVKNRYRVCVGKCQDLVAGEGKQKACKTRRALCAEAGVRKRALSNRLVGPTLCPSG